MGLCTAATAAACVVTVVANPIAARQQDCLSLCLRWQCVREEWRRCSCRWRRGCSSCFISIPKRRHDIPAAVHSDPLAHAAPAHVTTGGRRQTAKRGTQVVDCRRRDAREREGSRRQSHTHTYTHSGNQAVEMQADRLTHASLDQQQQQRQQQARSGAAAPPSVACHTHSPAVTRQPSSSCVRHPRHESAVHAVPRPANSSLSQTSLPRKHELRFTLADDGDVRYCDTRCKQLPSVSRRQMGMTHGSGTA